VAASLAARQSDRAKAQADCELERLYARYAQRVFRYSLRFLRDPNEAEDALQTTFLFALRALRRGVRPRLESAWLLAIARNVCLSRVQASQRRGRVEVACDAHILQETSASADRLHDEMISLEAAMVELSHVQRHAILLREWQGLSYREIATVLGLSLAAVETHIFRARRALARLLDAEAEDEKPSRPLARTHAAASLAWLKSPFAGGGALKLSAALAALASGAVISTGFSERAHAPAPTLPTAAAVDVGEQRRATNLKPRPHVPAPAKPRKSTREHSLDRRPNHHALSSGVSASEAATNTIGSISRTLDESVALRGLGRIEMPLLDQTRPRTDLHPFTRWFELRQRVGDRA
jgi:RNA polymerase sigma factor (sigma-70 family)